MSGVMFRAIWPIVDETRPYADLCKEAAEDLPRLIATAHAVLEKPGRFSVAPSEKVPGSGRVTPSVLLYEAPARRSTARRPYRKTTTC